MVRGVDLVGDWECEGAEFTQVLDLHRTGECTLRYEAANDAVRRLLADTGAVDHGTWHIEDGRLRLRFTMIGSAAVKLAGLYPPAGAVLVLGDVFGLRGEDVYDIHKVTALKLNLIRGDGVKLEFRR